MPVQDHPRSRPRRGHRTPPPLTATAQGHSSKQDTTLIPPNMSNLIKKVNFKIDEFFLSKWKINWNWHDSIQECFSSDEKKITLKINLIYCISNLEIILMNICLKLCDFREIANFWVMLAGYILCYVHLTSVNIASLFYTWLLRHNKLWYYLSCCIHVVTLLNLMRKK